MSIGQVIGLPVAGGQESGTPPVVTIIILNEVSQMQQLILGGTSQIVTVSIRNSTTGQGLTGLVFNTAGLTAYYTREATGTPVAITLATMTAGTWASGGFVEVDATNQKGIYQLGVPDALAAASELYADISLTGAANMFDTNVKIELVNQIDLGSDSRTLVSADAHTSGETIAANAAINTTAGSIDNVALVATTTTNTDMRGTDSAALATGLATLSAKVGTLAIPKNAIFADFNVLMLLTADNQPALLKTVTVERSIDGGAFAAATGSIAELSDGLYTFDSTAADTNGDSIVWLFKADDCNNAVVAFQTVR